jgi:penicillin-binding protein 2
MRLESRLRDRRRESLLVRNRLLVAFLAVVLLMAGLVARLYYLQVISHEHFATLSEDNRVKVVPVPPTRGFIYDRQGVVLAHNRPSFSLELTPESNPDLDGTVHALEEVVDVRPADLARFRTLLKRRRRFESVPLRLNLSEEEVARFAINRHLFPGVDVEARMSREYPLGAAAAHVVGYVGRIDEQEAQVLDPANYAGSTHVGKVGVEKGYQDALHGRVGYEQVETNAAGRLLRVLSHRPAVSGQDVHLHLDMSLQLAAEEALGEENGAIVVLEPHSGAVLALVSKPGYDPNPFVNGIDAASYRALQRSRDRPLYNRALRGQYPPGSTIKPIVALAGLRHNLKLAHGHTYCRGFYQLPGSSHRYRDWKKEGHGRMDLRLAIVRSCDVFFYEMALALGIDRLHDFMARFGFGQPTGIDVGGEQAGLMPSTAWKRKARGQDWYSGETVIAGIGQGYVLTTPIQLASAAATLATRGRRAAPRVARTLVDPATGKRTPVGTPVTSVDIPETSPHWKPVIQGMVDVVHAPNGTAHRIALGATYRIAGKTGTAQVFSLRQDQKYNEKSLPKHLKDHALFIAFAPADDPRIAVAVLVEHGGGGSRAAAPVARKVMDHYLLGAAAKAGEGAGGPAADGAEAVDEAGEE